MDKVEQRQDLPQVQDDELQVRRVQSHDLREVQISVLLDMLAKVDYVGSLESKL